jgi:hypothetical protein
MPRLNTDAAKNLLKKDYGVKLEDADIFLVRGVVYVATSIVCEILKITPHVCSMQYVKPLVSSGVRRAHLGKNKYYCLVELLTRIDKAIEKDKSVLEICELMKIRR